VSCRGPGLDHCVGSRRCSESAEKGRRLRDVEGAPFPVVLPHEGEGRPQLDGPDRIDPDGGGATVASEHIEPGGASDLPVQHREGMDPDLQAVGVGGWVGAVV
jgi:hypothetical protein